MPRYSADYLETLAQGPFPGMIDPWSEIGWYFQQIHNVMIVHLLGQIRPQVLPLGYLVGIEASLQIAEGREPDVFIHRPGTPTEPDDRWNYAAAAAALRVEIGVQTDEPELQAIYIKDLNTGTLVTVVEVISPSNKSQAVAGYRVYRQQLLHQGVNVVEIDATRSVKRLLENRLTAEAAYHVAVYLPGDRPYLLGSAFGEHLKRFALPLRGEAIAVDPRAAYAFAYREASIAGQIEQDMRYSEDKLPFPSLIPVEQRQAIFEAVNTWREQLAQHTG